MGRELVQSFINQRIIGNRCLACCKALEPSRALSILCEQAVDVGSHDASASRNCPLQRSIGEACESPGAVWPFRQPHMHLISGEPYAVAGCPAYALKALLRSQSRLDVKQAQTID